MTSSHHDFLKDLNDSQLEAVTNMNGASLIIAGAGSGKTRVLTYKISHILSKGVSPSSILALTFTNKSAREMKERIGSLIGYDTAKYLWMGTFHSIFSRILRAESEHIGYSSHFTIYDTIDTKNLLKTIIKELNLDNKKYSPNAVYSRISNAKNILLTAANYFHDSRMTRIDLEMGIPRVNEIYAIYSQRCKQANAMDFDDLLLQTNLLFRTHPEILAKYQDFFTYLLVDEYQDTNFSQHMIVSQLAAKHNNITAVGDDAQSIYAFRGANIDNILNFQKTYRDVKIFKLEQNYRSTQNIVNVANSLIAKNSNQLPKNIFSENEVGTPIRITGVMTDMEEANNAAQSIKEKEKMGIAYAEMAILYRTNAQSRVIEEALRREQIPYRIYGGISFYQRKEVKDVIAYFRLATNHYDEEAFKRIINYPKRGIGTTTLDKIAECAKLHEVPYWKIINNIIGYNLPVNTGTATKLTQFSLLMKDYTQMAIQLDAYQFAEKLIKSLKLTSMPSSQLTTEELNRIENIEELLNAIHIFVEKKRAEDPDDLCPITDFLSEVSLLTDQDNETEDDPNRVTLMTVHAAKGLEFENVIIVGMEEELFPSFFIQNQRDLEEERRLFYVAITRAKSHCSISYSKSRFRNGKTTFSNPSRFLNDLEERYVEIEELQSTNGYNDYDDDYRDIRRNVFAQKREESAPATHKQMIGRRLKSENEEREIVIPHLPIGATVKHRSFGTGQVTATHLSNGNETATVNFQITGTKKLLLKFAQLEVIS